MNKTSIATIKKQHIEKFKGNFANIQGGCTVSINKTIQSINNLEVLGIYIYLSSQPPEWEISAQQLANHFNIGINKTRRILTELVDLGLLERIPIKEKGKFIKHEHNLHLKPLHGFGEVVTSQSQSDSQPPHGYREVENRETETVKRKRWPNKTITSLKRKEEKMNDQSISTPKNLKQNEYNNYVKSSAMLKVQPLEYDNWILKNGD